MERNRYVYLIVFTRGPIWSERMKGKGWRRRLHFIRRRPGMAYQLLGSWLSMVLTGSEHRHIVVTDMSMALDHSFDGVRYRLHEHLHHDKSINGWVSFESSHQIHWPQFEGREATLFGATVKRLLMWATRGLYQFNNCTATAREVLFLCGIQPPRRCWNPRLLLQWFTENGYDFTAGPPPSAGGTTDR